MKIIPLIILITSITNLNAQLQLKGIVNYGHKQSFGMGAPIGIDYNAQLVFNTIEATYTYNRDSLEGGHINEMTTIRKNDKEVILIGKKTTEQGLFYHLDRASHLLQSRDIGYVYVKDSIPKIDWEISDETKNIGHFLCTKATTSFRGRDYTAWFSTNIPLSYGPWKLQGLPGLILEAYDTNKEILFYFKSIEYPTEKNVVITIPDPRTENKKWMSDEGFKTFMLERYDTAIKSGRMFSEQSEILSNSEKKIPMGYLYIEVFE